MIKQLGHGGIIPIRAEDYNLLGIFWQGKYYDRVMPMG